MCIVMVCFLVDDVINFGINLTFPNQATFIHDLKGQDKILNILAHLLPMHPFFTLWKYQKTVRFSDFFQGVEKGYIEI